MLAAYTASESPNFDAKAYGEHATVLFPEGLIQKQDHKDALISRAWLIA